MISFACLYSFFDSMLFRYLLPIAGKKAVAEKIEKELMEDHPNS